MLGGETETGLRELGKSVQELLFYFFGNNMPNAHECWMQTNAILAQFDGDYHIDIVLRTIYPCDETNTDPDMIDREIFRFHTNAKECVDAHHATITVSLYVNEDDTLLKKGSVHVEIRPILLSTPGDDTCAATDFFDDILAKVFEGKDERGH